MVTSTLEISSGIVLQMGSGAGLVLAVALGGVALFLLVLFIRMRMIMHTPKVTFRVQAKPGPTDLTDAGQGRDDSIRRSLIRPPMTDPTELLQARSQWERLIQDAQSNEQLTLEQREAFIEEARRNIEKINAELETNQTRP